MLSSIFQSSMYVYFTADGDTVVPEPSIYEVEYHDLEIVSVEEGKKKKGAPRRPMSKELREKIEGLFIGTLNFCET